jgi:hypothetical protein
VTSLGQCEGELDGLEVPHLADEEDIGVLSKGGAQRPFKGRAVDADLSLVHGREIVLVDVLNGVLDGQDVEGPRVINTVDN